MKPTTVTIVPPNPEIDKLELRALVAFMHSSGEYLSLPVDERPDQAATLTIEHENRLYIHLCTKQDDVVAVYRVTNRGPLKRIKHGPLARDPSQIKIALPETGMVVDHAKNATDLRQTIADTVKAFSGEVA